MAGRSTDDDGLTVTDLVVEYSGARALDGISLRVAPGQRVALMGPNGAGKSTTIRALSRVLDLYRGRAVSGTIRFDGRNVGAMSPQEVVRAGIAHVPEGRKIFSELTVRENLKVAVPRAARGSAGDRIEQALSLFPALRGRLDMQGGWLSGGEQQMLAICRALMTGPRVLMIDELSLGLAPKVVYWIVEQLEVLRRDTHVGVLLVEQNARLALKFSDYAYVLENGRIAYSGDSDALLHDPEVESRYLGGGQAVPADARRTEVG
ncbi:ABC transporter ATP-binding protein [Phytohabitans sp. ZYX-F-186]|uniref:ABC transporter ATP-binding protein n=1 Tax=Phytohabitans maris TaxID=3071409 RepID=A0ABU0ZUV9_9ACTN|nr:ABC transporter ATP-binding protein [Phytohabitans sp. ZYX-F-186]MDQ7910831.1 ABC transporter ATP-binding protein [Phytohabitans sp. ZYX-F-186]